MYKPSAIGIAVTTYYPNWYNGKVKGNTFTTDKIRGDLALEFIAKAKLLGFQIVVVDGKSSPFFLKTLKKIPRVDVIKRRGIKRSQARRKAIAAVSKIGGVNYILLTEPEKISLLTDCMAILFGAMEKGRFDVIFPSREKKLFVATYPSFQVESELLANEEFNKILVSEGLLKKDYPDPFFGPSFFRNEKSTVGLYMDIYRFTIHEKGIPKEYLDPEEFSNTLFFPIVMAAKKGLRVGTITVPFSYPEVQKVHEEKMERDEFMQKRLMQRRGILLQVSHLVVWLKASFKKRKSSVI